LLTTVNIFNINWFFGSILSFTLSTVVNYCLCVLYIFESTSFARSREIAKIFLVSIFALIINQILLYFFIEIQKIELITAKMIAIIPVFFFNFYGRKKFVF
jgi:putative flippase GtrA